jgi:hypothetical protein
MLSGGAQGGSEVVTTSCSKYCIDTSSCAAVYAYVHGKFAAPPPLSARKVLPALWAHSGLQCRLLLMLLLLLLGQGLAKVGVKAVTWAQLLEAGAAKPVDPTPPTADDISTIMYTSGTTGQDPGGRGCVGSAQGVGGCSGPGLLEASSAYRRAEHHPCFVPCKTYGSAGSSAQVHSTQHRPWLLDTYTVFCCT